MPENSDVSSTREVELITELLYSSVASVREAAARELVDALDPSLAIALIEDAIARTRDGLKGKELSERLQSWSEAMRLLTLAGRKKPTSPIVEYAFLTRMSILVDMLQEYDEGIRWGRIALESIPPGQRHIVHGDLAIAHVMKGQNDLAEQHIKKAIDLVSDDGDSYWLARHRGNHGAILARTARFEEASAEFTAALKLAAELENFEFEEKFKADKTLVEKALEEEHNRH